MKQNGKFIQQQRIVSIRKVSLPSEKNGVYAIP
jgi:hypothetical protein